MFNKKKLEEKKPQHKINWYEDKYQSVLVWRNWLYVITLASIVGIASVCGLLFFMMPLKSVSPFVIQVDEKSGLSEVVESHGVKEYAANEMLIKYFAMQYISARENFDINTFKENTEIIRVMSSPDVSREYSFEISAENPQSPLAKYGSNTNRNIDLISFSVLSKTESGESIIQVRIKSKEINASSSTKEYYSVITISCYFEKNLELNEKERLINPLGFIVSSYKSDEEIQGEAK